VRLFFVLMRAVTYAAIFIGLFLVFFPGQIVRQFGVIRPVEWGVPEILGAGVAVAGGLLALWCVLTFAVVGRGTPAPFDPPRRLVVRGPYRLVRNPMYIGAFLLLVGAAVLYRSARLGAYAAGFLAVTHLFVVGYEEPTLTRLFGKEYDSYRAAVRRWLPRFSRAG